MNRPIQDKQTMTQKMLRISAAAIYLLISASFFLFQAPLAGAQSDTTLWSDPINLSQSGAASDPLVVVDAEGTVHVIWTDEFSGWKYTNLVAGEWNLPATISPPFGIFIPRLYSDSRGNIYAFWLNEENTLFFSRTQASRFGSADGWENPQVLAGSALDYDFEEDAQGIFHLAYARAISADGFSAGIYYRSSGSGGIDWSQASIIYDSEYFRSMTAETANVKIAATSNEDATTVFIAWDNRPRKRVYLARSSDGGRTWDESQEVDWPNPEQGFGDPFNIQVSAAGSDVLLIWQNGEPGSICKQSFQFSKDLGISWSKRQPMFEDYSLCADENIFLISDNNLSIMQSVAQNQIYFLAWNGIEWSTPQLQPGLGGFTDPQTLAPVTLGCIQTRLLDANQLLVVGCDTGEGGDIWATSRTLGDTASWFPDPSSWSPQKTIASSSLEIDTPVLVAGSGEGMHALWIQAEILPENSTALPKESIYYSGWNGTRWSTPVSILRSGDEQIYRFAAKFDPSGRLFVVWSDNQAGDIYFSWANELQAANPLEWNTPTTLPGLTSPISTQDIGVSSSGSIYVVYSIPLNENRGIYFASTDNSGQTWAPPVRIFNAVAAGWQMVDNPRIAVSGVGEVHVLWSRLTLPGSFGSQGLYYSRSADGGVTWSKEVEVTNAPVEWSQIIDVGGAELQRLWQEKGEGQNNIRYQVSTSGGSSWGAFEALPRFSQNQAQGLVSLAQDSAGLPHLLGEISLSEFSKEIWHWQWDGSRWAADGHKVELSTNGITQIDDLSAAISPAGTLGVVFSHQVTQSQTMIADEILLFSSHPIDLPENFVQGTPSAEASLSVQATPAGGAAPEQAAMPTEAAALVDTTRSSITAQNGTVVGIVIGTASAALIVFGTLLVSVLRVRKSRQ